MPNPVHLILAAVAVLAGWTGGAAAADRDGAGSFQSAGLTLHYSVNGKGSPVLLLSGGPGFDPGYMRPIGEMLAKDHTVILLDQRGTGRSIPAHADESTLNQGLLVADIEALRRQLGFPRLNLVGHSFGTFTAMRYAIAHADHVSSLVLLSTMAPRSADDTAMQNIGQRLGPESLEKLGQINAAWPKAAGAERDGLMMEMSKLVLPAYVHDPAKAAVVLAGMPAGSIHGDTTEYLNRAANDYDIRDGLAKLTVPVLIVQGRFDPLDVGMAEKTRDAIPAAKLVILEHSGHFGWIEDPAALSAALVPFLQNR